MIKKLILPLCAIAIVSFANAQKTASKRYQFHSNFNVASIVGDHATSGGVQLINGVQTKNTFVGVGIGLDYYRYRTMPIFVDARYQFGKKANKPFIYADAGVNVAVVQDEFKIRPGIWGGSNSDFNNGFYADAGVGYNLDLGKGRAFVIAVGLSHKTMTEEVTSFGITNDVQKDKNTYQFSRLIGKIGLRF